MNIGDLFVSLGIKGTEKTVGALSSVKTGLSDTKSMAIETKAGILAVVYGLEQMMSTSMRVGTSLMNFETLVGVSTDKLQEYQYVTRQVGGSNEEMASSFQSISDKMRGFGMGVGDPAALNYMASKIGGYDSTRYRDPEYMFQQFQKFAQLKDIDKDMKRWALGSMGIGEHVQVGMQRAGGMYNAAEFAKAPKYSHGEAQRLDKARAQVANLENKVEMAIGRFTSRHGGQLASDLGTLIDPLTRLAEALDHFATSLKVFDYLKSSVQGWASAIGVVSDTAEAWENIHSKDPKKAAKGQAKFREFRTDADILFRQAPLDALKQMIEERKKAVLPKTPSLPAPQIQKQQDIEINQHMHFQHDGKEHAKTGDSTKHAVQSAFRAMSAQRQAN